MTYDDKIDAMYEVERAHNPYAARASRLRMLNEPWVLRLNIEDKRNIERLEAYRVKRTTIDRLSSPWSKWGFNEYEGKQ